MNQFERYSEDDDTITDTGRTFSSIADQGHDSPPFTAHDPSVSINHFENIMKNPEVSRYQNTYFMDGGNRFISVRHIVIFFSHIF